MNREPYLLPIGLTLFVSLLFFGGARRTPARPPASAALRAAASRAPHAHVPPASIAPSWWASTQRDLAAREYRPGARNGRIQAPNRAQNFRVSFSSAGVRLRPRIATGASWSWTWRSLGFGRSGAIAPLEDVEPALRGNRVEYARPGLVEWYENGPSGLEQGFTVSSAPSGRGPLVVSGAILTSRRADLAYGALSARDARGRALAASLHASANGIRIEVEDQDAAYPITIDPLITSPAWTAQGAQAGENLGLSVATAGDVNGDGFSDVVVGAPLYDGGLLDQGAAFVYFGSSTGLALSPSATLTGDQSNDQFGASVSPAGDTNGDGFGDLAVGAYGYTNGQPGEGRVYVYMGSSSGPQPVPWMTEGDQDSAGYGYSIAAAGDVNQDGFDDLLIGAYRYDNGQIDEGRAYLFLGGSGGLSFGPQWTAEGDQDNAWFGASVSSAGDVNGDGYDDLIVGAPHSSSGEIDEGRAFVYLGSASGATASPSVILESNQVGARFGTAVSLAGDVNGDGYGDLVVGAPLYDSGQIDEGKVFLYPGSASGVVTTASWTAESNQSLSNFGGSLATAGDVNGDGYADVIVGAAHYDNGQTNEGMAFAYLGSATGLSAAPAWTAESNQTNARLGTSVASAGDVNGDGYGDIVVGAPFQDGTFADVGSATVYQGAPAGPAASPAWSVSDQLTSAQLGFVVAPAGDVNGDGYADVIVSAPAYDNGQINEGAVFVYQGSVSGLPSTASWSSESNTASILFGNSAAGAGDVNGDGYDDVLVGAPLYSSGENQEGGLFLYYGSASGLGPNGTLVNADWIAQGNRSGSKLGIRVAGLGDVNGDGYADIAAGAYTYGADSIPQGRVYVYLGSSTSPGTPTQIAGEQDYSEFGYCVAAAGDVNGDGFADMIASARRYSGGNLNEGKVYVYYGSRAGIAATAAWTAQAGQDSAQFGYRCASAGDVNGDGYSDVIVGAPLYDNGQKDEGKVFVYYGSSSGLGPNGTPANADWTAESNQIGANMGGSVASAGDLNGDGYGDIVVGCPQYDDPEIDEGAVFVYYGSASGLGASGTPLNAGWSAEGNQGGADLGVCASVAGDVNGDGYTDLIVGADLYDTSQAIVDNGRAVLYYGNGSGGLNRTPRQSRTTGVPLSVHGTSDSQSSIRLQALGRSAVGRTTVRSQWELIPTYMPFSGKGLGQGAIHDTGVPVAGVGSATALSDLAQGRVPGSVHHWRLRTVSRSPFFPRTPWFSPGITCPTETHLRLGGTITGVEDEFAPDAPAARLWPARPNPSGGRVSLSYTLKRAAPVHLGIYDVQGRLVTVLVDRIEPAGTHLATWTGSLPDGTRAGSGVYFASLRSDALLLTRKIILAR